MARTSSGKLAAAVSNAGGFGVVGGLNYTPQQLKEILDELKENLIDPSLPFGVDLAIPKIGDGARKTNHDYTHGKLDDLITVTIESGAKLFVCAVGVPPKHVVDRLHRAGILIMNMVGAPKHVHYALKAGADMVCAQGGEGGGHTGAIATGILVPACVDAVQGYKAPMTGKTPLVLAAGGIRDGRSLAAALMMGAAGVWVGTRFVASVEAGCAQVHKEEVVSATFDDTVRTIVVSGRPMRVKANAWVRRWEAQPEKILELTSQGIIPYEHDVENEVEDADRPHLMGQVAGIIDKIVPAKEIVDEMVDGAVEMISRGSRYVVAGPTAKL
jgi:NAD(P)H-dependent flavin oxidoreductase YrpB (nitropropane dioxygenase family)